MELLAPKKLKLIYIQCSWRSVGEKRREKMRMMFIWDIRVDTSVVHIGDNIQDRDTCIYTGQTQ